MKETLNPPAQAPRPGRAERQGQGPALRRARQRRQSSAVASKQRPRDRCFVLLFFSYNLRMYVYPYICIYICIYLRLFYVFIA